ncbi:hypothetical protein [Pelotomaculum sp. FP]|nr:hypothetical protein [Pelotomaculum sp. FP]
MRVRISWLILARNVFLERLAVFATGNINPGRLYLNQDALFVNKLPF